MANGRDIGHIVDALLSAFPRRADLGMMVRIQLDVQLDVVAGDSNLRTAVFELVEWAEAQGRLDDLIAGARRQNPGNAALRSLVLPPAGKPVQETAPVSAPPAAGTIYSVGTATNSAVGPGAVVNNISGASLDAAQIERIVAAARGGNAEQIEAVRAALAALDDKVARLFPHIEQAMRQSAQATILTISARLDAQQLALNDAILDAIQQNAIAADELDRHLAVIRTALVEVHAQSAQIADRQLADSAADVLRLADDPSLDAKHKIEVAIPLIPLLVDYKFELELGSKANLVAVWDALKARVTGGR